MQDSNETPSGEVDEKEIEAVADSLGKLRASLSRNPAISDKLAKSIKDKECRLWDALPSEVEVNYAE